MAKRSSVRSRCWRLPGRRSGGPVGGHQDRESARPGAASGRCRITPRPVTVRRGRFASRLRSAPRAATAGPAMSCSVGGAGCQSELLHPPEHRSLGVGGSSCPYVIVNASLSVSVFLVLCLAVGRSVITTFNVWRPTLRPLSDSLTVPAFEVTSAAFFPSRPKR